MLIKKIIDIFDTMAVRNIERGYYELPVNTITLSFTGIYNLSVECDVGITNGSIVIIKVPSFSATDITNGVLTATIPSIYILPSSGNTVTCTASVNIGGHPASSIINLSVATGVLTIYADPMRSQFKLGIPWYH